MQHSKRTTSVSQPLSQVSGPEIDQVGFLTTLLLLDIDLFELDSYYEFYFYYHCNAQSCTITIIYMQYYNKCDIDSKYADV